MKRLGCLLTGRPHSLEDCLDLCKSKPSLAVRVDLSAEELFTEIHALKHLVARYLWRFSNATVCCEKLCGNVSLQDRPARRRRCIYTANRRLQQCLEDVERLGVEVSGRELRFDESWVMRGA